MSKLSGKSTKKSSTMSLTRVLCSGVFIHVILLFSIFDIYFKSPVIKGVEPVDNTILPPGKRVVFISVDGLRFDSLFDKDPVTRKYVAGYMQNVIATRGSWGISQSHVPTESRPGHVAMLAGFYEDPSAVTRGWKENPVDFDSIFNRSYCVFAWGSPDIVNIFFKGLQHDCSYVDMYKSEQNFAGDSRKYDDWVLDKVSAFLRASTLSRALYNEGLFFFLHLLGQDTSGHKDKPHTEKYRQNLRNVDQIVEKLERVFYTFYGDDKTTFIFTSDHGMTDWGSHGSGDEEETNTPFVAWGAGIRKPISSPQDKPIYMNQADITPLLAVLVGSSIPVNSIGTLPIPYLNMSKRQLAEATLMNAKQISATYLKVLEDTERHMISMFHVPFKRLLSEDLKSAISSIGKMINNGKYAEAIESSQLLIKLGLEGVDYYQNYYRRPLLFCVSLSYLAWIFYLLFELLEEEESSSKTFKNLELQLFFSAIVSFTLGFIMYQQLPMSYCCYAVLPEYLWYCVIRKVLSLRSSLRHVSKQKLILYSGLIMLGVEILVICFFKKWLLAVSLFMMICWSLYSFNFKSAKLLMCLWLVSGFGLGLFSVLPPYKGPPNTLMVISAGLALTLQFLINIIRAKETRSSFKYLVIVPLLGAVLNSYHVHTYFNEFEQLRPLHQCISWCLMFVACLLATMKQNNAYEKLCHVCMSLSIPFVLLSISFESFFLTCLVVHLFCWVLIETTLKSKRRNPSDTKKSLSVKNQKDMVSEFRIAFFFLTYIFLSFFGLGNTTSLNSFDPAWIRTFVTVFSPFLMSGLILLKTMIPFLMVTCTLRIMTVLMNIKPGRLFIIVLIYSNIMGLNFLFLIRNKGSWLDIGTSISHYVIQQVTIVFLVLLYGVAKLITTFTPPPPVKDVAIQCENGPNVIVQVPFKAHKA